MAENLSEKQLIKILTTLPLNGAIEQLRNVFKNNTYVSFLGLFIKNNQHNETKSNVQNKLIIDRNTNKIINHTKI
ncbi:MAG TPA: hypothetical protein PKN54_10705, partial [Candidatus Cloacimonas acidaminovorans]|nr:hypothetical protein [Candidatus Cloacimonas acidaminovorans]